MQGVFKLIFIFLISATVLSQTPKDGMLEDVRLYKEIISYSHTGIYLYTSEEQFTVLFNKLEEDIQNEIVKTDYDFFHRMAQIHTMIRCGHSSMEPSNYVLDIDSTTLLFPLEVRFAKDTLVALKCTTFEHGAIIYKINDHAVDEIIERSFKLITSDGFNTTFKYRILEEAFWYYYKLLYPKDSIYTIEYSLQNDESMQKKMVNGVTLDAINIIEEPDFFTKLTYLSDSVALLEVPTFYTQTSKKQKQFFKDLDRIFSEIEKKKIPQLIIDIRQNTGGDDGNDMELASYLIDKKFKENKYRKLNNKDVPLYPGYLHESLYEMFGVEYGNQKAIKRLMQLMITIQIKKDKDEAYYYREMFVIKRKPKKNGFRGDVRILTSGKVFSGGALFSALVRDKSDAVFIGEETGGGYYRHTGSIPLIYELPNSKLVFSIFLLINEQDVDQKLVPEGHGTQPQIEVYPSVQDLINGNDRVLLRALNSF